MEEDFGLHREHVVQWGLLQGVEEDVVAVGHE